MNTHWADILKVNIASWSTIGVTQSGIINMAEIVQAMGTAVLILVTLGYTIYKWATAIRRSGWEKEDRENDKS